jgi:hypothetical protein
MKRGLTFCGKEMFNLYRIGAFYGNVQSISENNFQSLTKKARFNLYREKKRYSLTESLDWIFADKAQIFAGNLAPLVFSRLRSPKGTVKKRTVFQIKKL